MWRTPRQVSPRAAHNFLSLDKIDRALERWSAYTGHMEPREIAEIPGSTDQVSYSLYGDTSSHGWANRRFPQSTYMDDFSPTRMSFMKQRNDQSE
ncbi:unnamed protein product [Protopolystoma xenopodis]|uniref:Uncharacterized protein n=1 Tax=Protopolystoma xenopodis TaxID=117903 RepID=A0A448X0Z5_9PLAT|nr:unnamed protein product [Protopolystoma xenopodis]